MDVIEGSKLIDAYIRDEQAKTDERMYAEIVNVAVHGLDPMKFDRYKQFVERQEEDREEIPEPTIDEMVDIRKAVMGVLNGR